MHDVTHKATRQATHQATHAPALADRRPSRYASAMRWGVDRAPRLGHPLQRSFSRRGRVWRRAGAVRVGLIMGLAKCECRLDWLIDALGQTFHEERG